LRNKLTDQYAEPGKNFIAAVIEGAQGEWREEIVSFWTAVLRHKANKPLVNLNAGEKLLYSFQANELYLINLPESISIQEIPSKILSQHLFRVQKFSSQDYAFRLHNASTLKHENEFIRIKSFGALNKINPIKVGIDSTGNLII
jgi:CRISPR-associated endonuclease Csn1